MLDAVHGHIKVLIKKVKQVIIMIEKSYVVASRTVGGGISGGTAGIGITSDRLGNLFNRVNWSKCVGKYLGEAHQRDLHGFEVDYDGIDE